MPPNLNAQFPNRMIFHVDMDAFYTSVEQLENPSLRGKPVIVGGVDSGRGVVSAASYEARVFGIHSAMSVAEARRRCPHGVFIASRHDLYGEYSRRLMDYLSEYSPQVEQLSVDEAFLDMTGSEALFGDAAACAQKLKADIRNRLGLTASVGVAENKFLAKLASDVKKPDGLMVVPSGTAVDFLDPMPVERLWGVGKKTVVELHKVGLYTVSQLRLQPLKILVGQFGENFAVHIHNLANGRDEREVVVETQEKSISHERTFEVDSSDQDILIATILGLSDRVARRARKDAMAGRTITFVWRNPDFSRQSHSKTLDHPTDSSQEIFGIAKELFLETARGQVLERSINFGKSRHSAKNQARRFRLIGVRLSNFSQEVQQLSLFQIPKPKTNLDKAMDAVRNKFGEGAISRARLANPDSQA